ncbi:MAG: YciI family protein [Ilumatobacteraceae bacterium]
MPKYLMLIVESEAAYQNFGEAEFDAVMEAHSSFAQEAIELGGTILGGEALQPVATATFLRGTRGDAVAAVDNPSPDVKETLGGYYLVEATDDEHARAIAARCPAQYGYIEVRPIWEVGKVSET